MLYKKGFYSIILAAIKLYLIILTILMPLFLFKLKIHSLKSSQHYQSCKLPHSQKSAHKPLMFRTYYSNNMFKISLSILLRIPFVVILLSKPTIMAVCCLRKSYIVLINSPHFTKIKPSSKLTLSMSIIFKMVFHLI